jgi:hypothetical protein
MGHLIARLADEFSELFDDWRELVQTLNAATMYQKPPQGGDSAGEHLVRSARIVEQAFGGITANLWDDPFEWTLPEALTTPEKLLAYCEEVEATRKRGFELLQSDEDLRKEIMAPSGRIQLGEFLLDTIKRARHHLQHAAAVNGVD